MADVVKDNNDEKMVKSAPHERDGDLRFIDKLSDFIQKNRAAILGCGIALCGALAIFIAATAVTNALTKKALNEVEVLNQRYETLRFDIADESKKGDVDTLLADLDAFAVKNKGYASARAWELAASIHSDRKNWADAAAAWGSTAAAAKGSYLEPAALYNQAIALEEQNDAQGAVDLFAKAAAFTDFPGASRAQFNIGRLQEGLNKDAAIEAYKSVVNTWPGDTVWTPLAQSRIITLSLQ
jgi:tetratricopeptide (TPR) repeat protein